MKKFILILLCNTINLLAQPGAFNLTSPVNGVWANTTPTFKWSAASGATQYKLYVDGLLLKDNLTAVSYQISTEEALTEALHTWYVLAVDASDVSTQSSQTHSVRIDGSAPAPFNLISPSDGNWVNSLLPTFKWSLPVDAGSGVAKYQLWIDDALNRDNISSKSDSAKPSISISNGSHSWLIKAIDSVGNVMNSTQTRTVKVDNQPPGYSNISALSFDATHKSFVDITFTPKISYNFTIEAWMCFYQGGSTNYPRIISSENDGYGSGSYSIYTNGTGTSRTISFFVGGIGTITTSINLSAGTFYHIAATIGGSQSQCQLSIYVNGDLHKSQSFTGTLISTWYPLEFGRKGRGTNYMDCFTGIIDDVRIWNTCRSTEQIQQSMNLKLQGAENGLLGYWNFDENSGTILHDLTSNAYTGTISNASFVNTNLPNTSFLCFMNQPTHGQFLSISKPTFSWSSAIDTGIGFQKYQIWVDGILNCDNLSDSSYTPTTSFSYGQHNWLIKGFDLLGNNQASPLQIFHIDNQPPKSFNLSAPSDSTIVNIPTPDLTWQTTTDSAGGCGLSKYQLWINEEKNIDSIPITSSSTAPGTILNEGVYSWYIKAFDKLGNVRTSTQKRTFYVDYKPPQRFNIIAPSNSDTVNTNSPRFSWHKSIDSGSGIRKYLLYISGLTADTLNADTTFKTTKTLANGSYSWYVLAFDKSNYSAVSDTGIFVVNVLPPNVPTLIKPANGNLNLTRDFTLHWKELVNASSYDLQISSDSGFVEVIEQQSKIPDTLFAIFSQTSKLNSNTRYYWRIRAVNTGGTSNWSKPWSFHTFDILVLPVNAAVIKTDTVNLIWHRSGATNKYWVEIATDSLMKNITISDSTVTDTLKTIKGLKNSTSYWWRIKDQFMISGGFEFQYAWGKPSDIRKYTTKIPSTSILPKTYSCILNGITKSGGLIKYGLPIASSVSIKLYNIQGKLLKTICNSNQYAGYHQARIDFSSIAQGCYFLDFRAGNYTLKKKINSL